MFNKIKKNYFLLIAIFFIIYFLVSILGGERGFFSYLKKKDYLEKLKKEEKEIISKIKKLDTKNSLLTDNLDLDYVEFLIRDKFLLGKKNETVYIIKNNDN
tara:strand:+ start:173 stop:475 length:303 start_codon:yes stop_codon:yes gene_type:complete